MERLPPKGVVVVEPKASDFFSDGETGITEIVRVPSGDWRQYESPGEWQKDMAANFETDACVSFSANDALQTMMNWLIATDQISVADLSWLKTNGYVDSNNKTHFSDRFTAMKSGTTEALGNSLPNVAACIAKYGLVPESLWPFPTAAIEASPANAWAIYYSTIPANVAELGLEFLARFQVQNEWVTYTGAPATEATLQNALKIAPLQIATAVCPPWNTANVIQGCGGGTAHATMLDYADTTAYYILDHYVPFDKRLALNYTIGYAMRLVIGPVASKTPAAPSFTYTFNTNLTYGAPAGGDVTELQKALQFLKDPQTSQPYMTPGVFGPFGPQTAVALSAFQKDHGISDVPAGHDFGPQTRTAMNKLLA